MARRCCGARSFFLRVDQSAGRDLQVPQDGIIVCSFGDASANHAVAQTAFNVAAWATHQKIPVPILFVCEDNGIGISVDTPPNWIESSFAHRYGLAYFRANGLDLPDAYNVAAGAVEIFHGGTLIAAHARATERGRRSTRGGHRPDKHVAVIENQASRRKHPEETLRSAQGILRLARDFSPQRLEAACERALALKSFSYRTVRTLIETPAGAATQPALDLLHENVRGSKYFQ